MSETETGSTETYRLEHTRLRAGSLTDPVTGEDHDLHPHEEGRGGYLFVERPDSAAYLVRENTNVEYAAPEEEPSEEAIHAAQSEVFDFSETEVATAFAESRGTTLGSEDLDPATGYDPRSEQMVNDAQMRVQQAYETLVQDGDDDVAAYLRALPSESRQREFVRFLRDREGYL